MYIRDFLMNRVISWKLYILKLSTKISLTDDGFVDTISTRAAWQMPNLTDNLMNNILSVKLCVYQILHQLNDIDENIVDEIYRQ